MYQAGLPAPLQQTEIYDIRGQLLGRVDFLFDDISLAVEYDGAGKHNGEFGIERLVEQHRRYSGHPRPFPVERMRVPRGRAWRSSGGGACGLSWCVGMRAPHFWNFECFTSA